jgi:hypothetical protein
MFSIIKEASKYLKQQKAVHNDRSLAGLAGCFGVYYSILGKHSLLWCSSSWCQQTTFLRVKRRSGSHHFPRNEEQL